MLPTDEKYSWNDLEILGKNIREKLVENQNDMSYWFPIILEVSNIPMPKTRIFQMTDEFFGWVMSDHYTQDRIKVFNNYLLEVIKNDFDIEKLDIFMKTGTFSDKYYFNNPHVTNKENIGSSFLNIHYGAMVSGAGISNHFVVREFIPTPKGTPTIYNGLPLRREIRYFVDFDNKTVIGYSDYWDASEMKNLVRNVIPAISTEDINESLIANVQYVIDNNILTGEQSNNNLKDFVTWAKWYLSLDEINDYLNCSYEKIQEIVELQPLKGCWSIDVLFNEPDEMWLIDMALMNQSSLVDVMKRF